ncbi:erythromycin esterase family protein [Streptomyces filamentosus]|uniref:erythromycin esterase family protein n=1 Tax=Streptomyces filamentosus TaxID=67294 RepID=UPI0037D4B328
MAALPARPRLLALGEPTHGEDVLLDVRNDLFRQLVEEEGYRTIALESDCLAALTVDAHVTSGAGAAGADSTPGGPGDPADLDDVMAHGFSHGFGASPANRELVRWMRAHNEGRAPADRVRFAGFDGPLEMSAAQSPRRALTALHAHLALRVDASLLPCAVRELEDLLGEDDRWTDPAVMGDPSRSAGRTPTAERLRILTDDLTALLDAHAPPPEDEQEQEERHRARLHARTATGLLRYHAAMADPTPARLVRLLTLRASMMAANLLALAERAPTLVHAHNSHLQRDRSSMTMAGRHLEWWSAGALAHSRLGEEYGFVATALGTLRHHGVHEPPPDTVEGLLHALPADRFLLDPRHLSTAPASAPPTPRPSPWHGYAPLDPAHLPRMDALLYIKHIPEGPKWWPTA